MAIYTVHEPPLKRYQTAADPERFKFVRDGFSFWAFLVTPLWMLWHRMWLMLIAYLVVTIGLEFGLAQVDAPASVQTAIGLLISIFIGIEAGTLRRFVLSRRGWQHVGVVAGDDREAAERRFFERWLRRSQDAAPPPAMSTSARVDAALPDVLGLFPQSGPQR